MEFILVHEIDILLVQEVTKMIQQDLFGYEIHYNIGTSKRGTAIVTREGIRLENIIRLPSGRAIGARFRDTWIINIYAPSGPAKRHEREHFYSTDLAYLLTTEPQCIVMGGDFNCVLKRVDTTGNFNYSRALDALVGGMDLHDT
jgi:exonuclease III